MSKTVTRQSRPSPALALVLAWLVPGAGHVYLGRTVRGVVIFVTITATFWAGVAMGGATTVNRRDEPWWFTAQMLTGVNGFIGWQLDRRATADIYSDPAVREPMPADFPGDDRKAWQDSLIDQQLADRGIALVSPTETVARAYSGVAGMLNLLCVFDACLLALMGVTGEPKRRATEEPAS